MVKILTLTSDLSAVLLDACRQCQGRQIDETLAQMNSKWTNVGFVNISSSIYRFGEPTCTETDPKNSQICPIWGQSDPI